MLCSLIILSSVSSTQSQLWKVMREIPSELNADGENYQECMQFTRSESQSCTKAFECYVSGFKATDPLCSGDSKSLICRRDKNWTATEYDGSKWLQPVLKAHKPTQSEQDFVSCLLKSPTALKMSPIHRIKDSQPPTPIESTQQEEEDDGFYDNVYHRLHKRNKENMVVYALLIAIVISVLILLLHTQNSE